MSRTKSTADNNSVGPSASPSFVLDEYGHVPVTAPGLKKDQLKDWEPFKVCVGPSDTSHARPLC